MLKDILKVCRLTWNLFVGDVSLYPKPIVLHEFKSVRDLSKWQVFTDATFGGKTTATLHLNADKQAAIFSGEYYRGAASSDGTLRYGYCGISTKVTAIGEVYDLDQYSALQYRVRGDGRTYIANLRLDNFTGQATDVWQVPFRTVAGEWQEVTISFDSFVPTKQGRLFRSPLQLVRGKIISVGLALAPWDFHPLPPASEGAPAPSKQQQQQQQQPGAENRDKLEGGLHADADRQGEGDSGDESEGEEEEFEVVEEVLIQEVGAPFQLEIASITATGVAESGVER